MKRCKVSEIYPWSKGRRLRKLLKTIEAVENYGHDGVLRRR
ncbi:hypothetical protein Z949_2911 [Sulfitobacter guttiformis KCTC 32187]|nr:hypothetical protein Z949_2911 [Sulfitobacter guttiformis KCTC 32187]